WVRDRAQQAIVDKQVTEVAPALRTLLKKEDDPVTIAHALWTLEGIHALTAKDLVPLLTNTDWRIREQALAAVPSVISKENYKLLETLLDGMVDNNDTLEAPDDAFLIDDIRAFNKNAAEKQLLKVTKKYPSNRYVASTGVSNQQGLERGFYNNIL